MIKIAFVENITGNEGGMMIMMMMVMMMTAVMVMVMRNFHVLNDFEISLSLILSQPTPAVKEV